MGFQDLTMQCKAILKSEIRDPGSLALKSEAVSSRVTQIHPTSATVPTGRSQPAPGFHAE